MTSVFQYCGSSKYLKADDFPAPRQVTLNRFALESVEGRNNSPPEEKIIAYFAEMQKGMVLNKTNGGVVARMLATDVWEEWQTKIAQTPLSLEIFSEMKSNGENGLSVRPAATPPQPAADAGGPPTMDPAMAQQFAAFQQFLASQNPPQ